MALSNTQYDEIIRQYNAKQIRNRHIVESRVEEVYSKNPRLQEIDDSISSCSVEKAKQLLDGDVKALSELKEQTAPEHPFLIQMQTRYEFETMDLEE